MELKGSLQVFVSKITIKADSQNDGQQILVDCSAKVTQETIKGWGEAFEQIAFGDMRSVVEPSDEGDATVTRFGYSKKSLPAWARLPVHKVNLWGNKQNTQPQIRGILAGDDEAAVTVEFRFVFDIVDKELIGELGTACGETKAVHIEPLQGTLAFMRKPDGETAPLSTAQKRQKRAPKSEESDAEEMAN